MVFMPRTDLGAQETCRTIVESVIIEAGFTIYGWRQVPVDVSVRFAPLTVSSADLLSLAVGDVLLLRHAPDSPLEVTTNDVTFAYAIASNHRRRLAATVVPTPHAAVKDSA